MENTKYSTLKLNNLQFETIRNLSIILSEKINIWKGTEWQRLLGILTAFKQPISLEQFLIAVEMMTIIMMLMVMIISDGKVDDSSDVLWAWKWFLLFFILHSA